MNRLRTAQYIALAGTVFSVLGWITAYNFSGDLGGILLVIGFITGLISYLFGGLLTAIKMAGGIAKWGWFIAPFPYDIPTFAFSFLIAIYAFIFLPIIPIRKAYKESMYY
ncbi:hypothetical protein [Oribacterium sp. FC2011]|uniref:hypothetical protein n=1 Tax=Oribacterium sp. FC2011 TaxID=1408311 RepID=UPI0004E10C8A|nr:hypothetical protein [Oribacterium sp. FC2011]